MKKLTHSKAEATIVILLTIIFLLLVWVGIKDSEVDRANHLTDCLKQCYPDEVDMDTSRFKCYCTKHEG